jgi:protease-4
MASRNDSASTTTVLYVVVVVVAVLIGTVLAPVAWNAASSMGDSSPDTVEVITLSGSITSSTADPVIEDLREARQNESTKAVVLKVDSGGGAVTASERLYLAVNRTAADMPVVASVTGVAASGAYYASAPADRIFTMPGATVGSIGVYASVTTTPEQVPGYIVRSAPDKATMTRDQVRGQVNDLQNSFVTTVMQERGDRLSLSREEVAHAKVYLGSNAVANGFADETGSLSAAIDHAAGEAGLGDDYAVHYNEPPTTGLGIILAESDDGNVVVKGETGDDGEDFATVDFYAHRGVIQQDDSEVIINATK